MTSTNNIETEFLDITRKMEWPTLFQKIRTQSTDNNYTCAEAAKPQNQEFNRYRDVNPYDHSRIILKKGPTDYVNANLVKVEKANRQYILTQGPTVKTISHFWLMVWEQKTAAIIMLNKLVEKKQEKCSQYWPAKIGQEHILKLEDVGLQVEYISQSDFNHYLTRTLKLTDAASAESRTILQYHYTTWPDFGVPGSPTVFLEFLRRVRGAGVLDETVGPAIVHCSAGIGRSGTFCLVDSVLVLIEKDGQNSVDVKEILLEMRKYRMGLIQTFEQLRFSYQAIIEGAKNLLCADKDNCNLEASKPISPVVFNGSHALSSSMDDENEEDDDEPPPLPPPRGDSLVNIRPAGAALSTPRYKGSTGRLDEEMETSALCPSGPLPEAPSFDEEGSSEDELEDSSSEEMISDVDDVDEEDEDENTALSLDMKQNRNNCVDDNSTGGLIMNNTTGSDQNENERTMTDDTASSPTTNSPPTSPTSDTSAPPPPPPPPTPSLDGSSGGGGGGGGGPTSPAAELRQRRRTERKQLLDAQVREMKRRQRSSERWRQLKRPKTTLPD